MTEPLPPARRPYSGPALPERTPLHVKTQLVLAIINKHRIERLCWYRDHPGADDPPPHLTQEAEAGAIVRELEYLR